MATTNKLALLAVAVLLLQASWCAVARHHHHDHPDPCGGDDSVLLRHKDHRCSSPAVSPHGGTRAVMTVNSFQEGGDGGGPSECDGKYHSDDDLIVALSTGWYAGGKRCHNKIRITSVKNGRTVVARVVDECDSRHGCRNNIVDTSKAVWKVLGHDTNDGEVPVTWSDA